MASNGASCLQGWVQRRDFSTLIRRLDAELLLVEDDQHGKKINLAFNKCICLHQLRLFRKASKELEAVLQLNPSHAPALVLQAKVLVGLKQGKAAEDILRHLLSIVTFETDIALVAEAQELLSKLESGAIKAGNHIPAFGGPSGAKSAASAEQVPTSSSSFPPPPPSPTQKPQERAAIPTPSPAPPADALTKHAPEKLSSSFSAPEMDPMNRLVAISDPSAAIGVAVGLVNSGKCPEAVAMLDLIEQHHGTNVAVLASRGTAKALMGDLPGSIVDFDAAILREPTVADFYKRRSQALAASGRDSEALDDLNKVLELSHDDPTKAEVLLDSAKIHQKQRDFRRAEAEVKNALELHHPATPPLLMTLASCQISQGDLEEGVATYRKALVATPDDAEAALNLGMALKEMSKAKEAEEALKKAAILGRGTPVHVTALRLLAQMKQGLGDHLGAVKELDEGLAVATTDAQRIELRFLKGACYHAVGLHREAIEHYQMTLEVQTSSLNSEAVSNMCLAFYQKEMALWTRAHLDDPVDRLCLDADLHPEFKELWCKKCPPSAEFVSMYRTIMQPQNPDWAAPRRSPAPPPAAFNALLNAADSLGALVQYSHQGFLQNRRQHRMAGFAALELAQLLQHAARARRDGTQVTVPDAGASVCGRGPSGVGGGGHGGSGIHPLGWRDAMERVVKWRQVAEPNDQVLWVDLLTEQEFSSGFGSHTPMFTGQTKCVRYYMNFDRALGVAKKIMLQEGKAIDADNNPVDLTSKAARSGVENAKTAEDLWRAAGKDCWVVVPIQSSTREGHAMEGTRLTVVKLAKKKAAGSGNGGGTSTEEELALESGASEQGPLSREHSSERAGQPDAYEFSIRTPVTPARWDDYNEELGVLFERLVQALAGENRPAAADAALRFTYCWYNFMPLARGSALCGYVTLLAAFLAAGMPVRASIPPSYQTDWEAILESSPDAFIESVRAWLWPPELGGSAAGKAPCPPVEDLPAVSDVLGTMRARLEALNGPNGPKI